MDNFGWDINYPSTPTSEMSFAACLWSSRHKEASKSSVQSHADYGIVAGDVDLAEAFLISSQGLHVVKTSEPTKLDVPPPPSQLDCISSGSAVEASRSQEALLLAAAAEQLAVSVAGTPWVDGALASLGHLREHFGLPDEAPQVHIDIADEEDVPAILSNYDNIPNLLSCSGNVSYSSGESENCSSLRGDEGPHHHCSNVDEVVSQASSHPDAIRLMPSQSRPNLKRKEREISECAAGEGSLYRDVLQSDSSAAEGGGFRIFFENTQSRCWKRPRSDKCQQRASSIDFRLENGYEPDAEAIAQVKEMIYRAAAMRPVSLGAMEAVQKPKRKNVRISSDPQTVAARHRREKISERLRVLQRLVPGGSKMDTASMLDEAANYLKFLKSQVSALETLGAQGINGSMPAASSSPSLPLSSPFDQPFPMQTLHPQLQTPLVQVHPQKGTTPRAPHPLQF